MGHPRGRRPTALETFAEITRRVIRKDGFEGSLPTVLLPARREVRVLEGIPADVAHEEAALRWADGTAQPGEEYLVAFKVSPSQFKVVRRAGGVREEGLFDLDAA